MSEREKISAILEYSRENTHLLYEILKELKELKPKHNRIERFAISQQGVSPMALLPVAPGFSPVYTATPVPAGTFPAAGNLPVWTSSDTVNAPVTADATGLIGTVAIPATAVVGTAFSLTVTYTNADSTVATGTLSQTIVAAPPSDITSFTIAQTS
jgi:hypothetical protein